MRCNVLRLGVRLFAVLFAFGGAIFGETAYLECTRSVPFNQAPRTLTTELPLATPIELSFQAEIVKHWAVTKATLMLHLSTNGVPPRLDIGVLRGGVKLEYLPQQVESHPDGWIGIRVPPVMIEMIATGKAEAIIVRERASRGRRIHLRESGQFAPQLIVEGTRK